MLLPSDDCRYLTGSFYHYMLKTLCLLLASAFSASAAVQLGIDVLQDQNFAPLDGKRVGLVTNQTGANSSGKKTRVILKNAKNVNLVALYSPEHGIDGTALAGKYVASRKDSVTGLMVHSLYGPTRKPSAAMLKGVDVLVYDMQDIGVRSYTYVSTMAKCMEAAGEAGIEFMVLDRPNPLGGTRVEGPGIEEKWRSFVGQLPTPYIHGMTVGELAKMANAKGWTGSKCNLTVIPMRGWSRGMVWTDTGLNWLRTSPNIPTFSSAVGYAATSIIGSLGGCGYELGLGDVPFQMLGHKKLDSDAFTRKMKGYGVEGVSYSTYRNGAKIGLNAKGTSNLAAVNVYLLAASNAEVRPFGRYKDADNLFWKIYGSQSIRSQIEGGKSPSAIVSGWGPGVLTFKAARVPYLLY